MVTREKTFTLLPSSVDSMRSGLSESPCIVETSELITEAPRIIGEIGNKTCNRNNGHEISWLITIAFLLPTLLTRKLIGMEAIAAVNVPREVSVAIKISLYPRDNR